MSSFDIATANTEDYLDVRDMIARVEELRDERASYVDTASDEGSEETDATEAWSRTEEGAELVQLESVLSDLRGNGGDEHWEGDWYPVSLIRDSYFEEAMDELIEDIGDMPKDIPVYLTITINYRALQMDYTSVEIDGVTYWYR